MINKEEVKKNFSRSAPNYEEHALLQKEMADQLISSLKEVKPTKILDIGCGTGYLVRQLASHYPSAEIVGLDLAPGMVEESNRLNKLNKVLYLIGDGENLPFAPQSFDLVVSNASLQWMQVGQVFKGVARILKPKGLFVFNTFGPKTLGEMKQVGFRVNKFPSAGELMTRLQKLYKSAELQSWQRTLYFKSVKELLGHLKELGAQTSDTKIKNKKFLPAFKKYKQQFGEPAGIPATFEVIGAYLTK